MKIVEGLSAIANNGVPAGARPAAVKHIQATNLVALTGALSIGSWAPLAALTGEWWNAAENALAACCFLFALWINRRGHPTAAALITLATTHLQLLWAIYLFGYGSASPVFYAIMVLVPYLIFPREHRLLAHAAAAFPAIPWVLAALFQEHLPQRMVLMPLEANAAVNTAMLVAGLMLIAGGFLHVIDQALDAVERERERADSVLLNVLPPVIAERLKRTPQATLAERHDAVSVLFADLVGFTPLSTRMSPAETVALLNEIFSAFDAICQRHGVEKIKTIGDGYMVIAGAPDPMPDHALVMSRVAQEMMDFMATCPATAELELRIGLNAGEAVSAIVGTTRFHWDLWGDAINTAARMESHGVPGRIHLTDSFHKLIADQVPCEARGSIEVKGKGAMDTWFIA